jgi:hypothetical protein
MAVAKRVQFVAAALAAWFAFVAVDFLIHAALLAGWWRATGEYWLSLQDLFVRIPYAYASFAICCIVLTWLLVRLYGADVSVSTRWRVGALAGLLYGTASVLAMYSVVRMPRSAFVVWPGSALIESAIAGVVAGWVLGGQRPWRRVGLVAVASVIVVIVAIVLQNILWPRG